jgi:phage gpG-like protein
MDDLAKDLRALAVKTAKFMEEDLPEIIATEGLNHIKKSFKDEGFTDSSLKKWKKRKTTDKRGRNITRYRTNRVGRRGSPNKYGRSIVGRPTLTGHATGGNKLRNSWRAKTRRNSVVFFSYKKYAQRHNEGLDGMPKRQYIGASKVLDSKIEQKITRSLDRIFKQ